jgi:hypothetical protein
VQSVIIKNSSMMRSGGVTAAQVAKTTKQEYEQALKNIDELQKKKNSLDE